jgi:hypothetical protein
MRGKAGFAVAAILAVAIPAGAQVRQIPVRMAAPPARPVILPNRTITYVRPAPPPVRVVDVPRVVHVASPPSVVPTGPVSPAAVPTPLPPSPIVKTLGGTPLTLGQLLNPAPGLGFDFAHLAAINSNLGVQAIIDPLTQYQLALALRLPQVAPTAFWGYGGYDGYVEPAAYAPQPSQPQIIVIQQPVPQAAPVAQESPAPAPEAAAPPQPPLPDVGQFLLVERDGHVIHAVAFSVEGKRLVYITADGLRHTIPLDQVDTRLTEERNAERGTVLHLTD